MHWLPKVHNPGISLRKIISNLCGNGYNCGKFIADLFSDVLKQPSERIANYFELCRPFRENKVPSRSMVIFDVINLFTNVPRHEAVDIAIKNFSSYQRSFNLKIYPGELLSLFTVALDAMSFYSTIKILNR